MAPAEREAELERAVAIVREAGALALARFRAPDLAIETKADGSPVTEADRAVERRVRMLLARHFPGDGVVGEEEAETPGASGRRWILDPVDGTEAFRRGVPLWGVLLALEDEEDVRLGVAAFPAVGELVAGARGLGAWWHVEGGGPPRRARVSPCERLADALVCFTSAAGFRRAGRADALPRLLARAGRSRGWSDAYGHALVATGRVDAMVDPVLAVWDTAPFLVLLEEAGGSFTSLDGERTIRGASGVSTNGRVHAEVLAALRPPSGTAPGPC